MQQRKGAAEDESFEKDEVMKQGTGKRGKKEDVVGYIWRSEEKGEKDK